jgi:hypothetical protein
MKVNEPRPAAAGAVMMIVNVCGSLVIPEASVTVIAKRG